MWFFTLALAGVGPGRNHVEVVSAPYEVVVGQNPDRLGLIERFEALGYSRVRHRPTEPGTYFFGSDKIWLFRPTHRAEGRTERAQLIGWVRSGDGRITGSIDADGAPTRTHHLPPEVLARSWSGDAGPRRSVDIETLPEHVWLPLLALEDQRFFDHLGVDPRGIARAAWANVSGGGLSQGGSTVTQQLVKNRDLSPRRSLDRKASEAVRALWIELNHDKHDILESYLDTAYFGHVDGIAVYGLEEAARVWFSKSASELDLHEAALLAAMVQGPNGLAPDRHPERALERRNRALEKLEQLGWIEDATRHSTRPLGVVRSEPRGALARSFVRHTAAWVEENRGPRRGAVVQTTLDPHLQRVAERAAARRSLDVSVVAMDARTGDVLAWVGQPTSLRQPGSTVKPFVVLDAIDRCGLHVATRVSDAPLDIDGWSPRNADRKNHGDVLLGDALVHSWNRPIVRVAEHCGGLQEHFGALGLPASDVASLPLGTVETSALALASAYTALDDGVRHAPRMVEHLETPGGRRMRAQRSQRNRVSRAPEAWIVRDLLQDAVERGSGRNGAVTDLDVSGKTGTTGTDAWFVGMSGPVVAVAWVGNEDGGAIRGSGGSLAAPLVAEVLAAGGAAYGEGVSAPGRVKSFEVDANTGLRGEGHALSFRPSNSPGRTWPWSEPTTVLK